MNAAAVEPLADLAGECSALVALREKVTELLRRQSGGRRQPPVLIQGETGTGKGLLARVLHQAGPRAAGPFVDVNCPAIPETLLEAELFGYERGAFTDARQAKPGLFQTAHGGTLFLDEIGLLSSALQSKLLNVLEAGAVRRLGSTQSQPVNVWIIAATNEDLIGAVRARRFREDLYHRLAVMTFTLPPLRERGRDAALLAERFLAQLCAEYGLPRKTLAPSALAVIQSYDWPGNIRELSNTIERAILLSDASVITADVLQLPPSPIRTRQSGVPLEAPSPRDAARAGLLEALTQTSWNISRTAALLGLTRNTVRARIERFALGPESAPKAAARRRPPLPPPDTASPTKPPDASPMAPEQASPRVALRWDRRRVALLRVELGEAITAKAVPLEWGGPLKVIIEKVQSFGGTVQDLSTDGIEASFGLMPIEDPARRAAHAGLAIRRELAKARNDPQNPPHRIAVHACEVPVVYAGDIAQIDGESRRLIAPLMDALVAAAEPGSIVASAATAAFLRRRFVLEPAPRSMPERPLYNVVSHDQFNIGEAGKGTRFVGRQQEVAFLQTRLTSVLAGRGQLAAVVGDPGMGKSRLVWEFTRSSQARAARLLETGSAYAAITPYSPVIELLRSYFAIGPDDDAERIREHLRVTIATGDGSLTPSLPALFALLGVPDADWDAVDPVERRRLTLEAVRRLLLTESRVQPLLIVFEDVHWIDAESQALLDALVEGLPTARVLLVVTYRPQYRHEWSTLHYYAELNVGPLSSDSANELLESLLGMDSWLEPVKRRLIDWTDGNPFFLEESVQALVETGALQGERGAYRTTRSTPAVEVPATIEDILATRIDRLALADKALVQSAAAIGAEVPMALLSAVVDLSPDAFRSAMRRLQAAELLFESGTTMGSGYVFKHALTREVAYRGLLPQARRDLHRRIVAAMEAEHLDAHVEALAEHAFRAEVWESAASHLQAAGTRALARSANRTAVDHLERAIAALDRVERRRDLLERAIDIRLDLRYALALIGEPQRALPRLREAEAIAVELDDTPRLGRVVSFLANGLYLLGDHVGAIAAARRATEIARALDDFSTRVRADIYAGRALHALGRYREATDLFRGVVDALSGERANESAGLPVLPAAYARSYLVMGLSELGDFALALAVGREAVAIADAAGHLDTIQWAFYGLGVATLDRGDADAAIGPLERALSICQTAELPVYVPRAAAALGHAYVLAGRPDGIALLEGAAADSEAPSQRNQQARFLARLAEAYLLTGRAPEAAERAARSLALAHERSERGAEAHALRTLAAVDEARSRVEESRASYEAALAQATELDMQPLAARCHLGLGRLHRVAGRRGDAGRHLAAAHEAFERLGMARSSRETGAELSLLG